MIYYEYYYSIELAKVEPSPPEVAESVDFILVHEHGLEIWMVPTGHLSYDIDTCVEKIIMMSTKHF